MSNSRARMRRRRCRISINALEARAGDVVGAGRPRTVVARTRIAKRTQSAAFEAALAADAGLTDVRRRVDVLKFRSIGRADCGARQAARAAGWTRRRRLTQDAIAASPDSPFLYRELRQWRDSRTIPDAALEHCARPRARSVGFPFARSRSATFSRARGIRQSDQAYWNGGCCRAGRRRDRKNGGDARAGGALAKLPAEYRAIEQAPQVTRADLAALIGDSPRAHWSKVGATERRRSDHRRAQQLGANLDHGRRPRRRHGAVRQPCISATRGGAARPTWRKRWRGCWRASPRSAGGCEGWETARLQLHAILPPGHLAYPAASAAVAADVMKWGQTNLPAVAVPSPGGRRRGGCQVGVARGLAKMA